MALRSVVASCFLALVALAPASQRATGQANADEPAQTFAGMQTLELAPPKSAALDQALQTHNYVAAETLLLAEIASDPHSHRAARLLGFIGGVYFLNHDYLHAAIAWKKSEAITALTPQVRFSLAMAYIRIGHSDWADSVLEALAAQDTRNALYPYWLGRLAYDAHSYNGAIQHFKTAIDLAPAMARAYDNLGLCYYYQNQNDLALANYNKAIELNLNSPHPSAWPYLNLATTLDFLNKPAEAEANLREAIRLDTTIAPAHFLLGTIFEKTGRTDAAISEFDEAGRLDPNYAEPHFALARTYNKLGRKAEAQQEVQTYLRIHNAAKAATTPR